MRKVTAEQAFEDYVALGPGRSLSKLEARYRNDTGVIQVSSATLRRWSSKFRWQARLAEHDEKVAEQVQHKLAKAEASERWNAAQDLRTVAQLGTKRLIDKIANIELKSGADAKAMTDAIVALIGKADVLEGGVSDRIEEIVEPEYRGLGKFRRKAEQAKAEAEAQGTEQETVPEGDDER
ncbi:MAG: hypothetical protein V3R88_11930 [Alphaproteobacteria bacterium]